MVLQVAKKLEKLENRDKGGLDSGQFAKLSFAYIGPLTVITCRSEQ